MLKYIKINQICVPILVMLKFIKCSTSQHLSYVKIWFHFSYEKIRFIPLFSQGQFLVLITYQWLSTFISEQGFSVAPYLNWLHAQDFQNGGQNFQDGHAYLSPSQRATRDNVPTTDPYHPENMLCYIRDGKQCIASFNENDPQNPYRRADLIYKIRDLIDSIQGIKGLRDITRGYIWNEWRRSIVEARTPDSYAQDKYFDDIYDNVDSYTTRELIRTLKELKQFWDYM